MGALIAGLRPEDSAADLAGALERVAGQIKNDEAARGAGVVIAILSDFFVGSADTTKPLPAALADMEGVSVLVSPPATSAPGNTQIVSVEPLRPVVLTGGPSAPGLGDAGGRSGGREPVRVTLRRSGASVAEAGVTALRVRFAVGDPTGVGGGGGRMAPESRVTISWLPGQSQTTVAVDVEAPGRETAESGGVGGGVSSALIAEIDRDAVAGDNIVRRPIGVREALRVGVVARRRFSGARAIETLAPAEWLGLALKPTPSAPIDVVEIDPQALDASSLAALEVVFAPAPDLLTDEAWGRLRRFVDAGGLLVVSPPPEATVHLWTDAMVRELGLGWRVAREPRRYDEGEGGGDVGDGGDRRAGGGIGLDDKPESSPLLSLIAAEIPALVKPVRVFRALPVEEVSRQSEVLLKLADGTPWLVMGEPGRDADEEAGAGVGSEEAGDGGGGDGKGKGGSRGLVLYLASAPALVWTDLPAKPLMVPLMQEITRQGFGRAIGGWATVAGRGLEAPARTATLRPYGERGAGDEGSDSGPIVVGGERSPVVRRAGLWTALDEAGRARGLIAVNADAEAGRLTPGDPASVRGWIAGSFGSAAAGEGGDAGVADSGARSGRGGGGGGAVVEWLDPTNPGAALAPQAARSPLSLPILCGAMGLALLEVFLARWFSHATRERVSGDGGLETRPTGESMAESATAGGLAA